MFKSEKIKNNTKKKRLTWRSWHKWVGLVFSVFIILFCLSGIVLNHRHALSHCEVSRWWLPSAYHIDQWNQNVIKGTTYYNNKVIAYGQCGVWITDPQFKSWTDMNDGLEEGIDNRKISNVIETGDGTLWCAGLWDIYHYDSLKNQWQKVSLPENTERVSDITLKGVDTIVVATRSALYEAVAPQYSFCRLHLANPEGYKAEYTMFKTLWMLHSGELFGIVGKIVVDILAIVIIILCLTGIAFFVLQYTKNIRQRGQLMKWNLKWHNKLGASLIILTTLLAVTGACLRPPLMIPFVMMKTAPVPYSTMDSDNAFHDKIRAIRWDSRLDSWLMSTSEGFYSLHGDIDKAIPVQMPDAPQISPMGISVFTINPADSTEWLIGSFSGLSRWNPVSGNVTQWFNDYTPSRIPTAGGHSVTGFTTDYQPIGEKAHAPVVFEYANVPKTEGTPMPDMPEVLKAQPMSLWNFALELHVGRCYEPFLGSVVSVLFVFISGTLLALVLLSGYIIYRRGRKKGMNNK